jgi:hypothetical protein
MFLNQEPSHEHLSAAPAQQCQDACLTCHRVCLETASTHCLESGNRALTSEHIRLLVDCAQICQVCADFIIRDSELSGYVAGLCSHIANECAIAFEPLSDDPSLAVCHDCCRQCADLCLKVSKVIAHEHMASMPP